MCHKRLRMIASCLVLLSAATFASALGIAGPDEQKVLGLALRGVYFVPNHGQWTDADVHFGLRSRGLNIAFRESALTMHLTRQTGSESRGRENALVRSLDAKFPDESGSLGSRADYEHLNLTVTFPGSNHVLPAGAKPQTAKFNYLVGGEGRGMASDVPSFGSVLYHNLYDGVDLHVTRSDEGVLKYEFHVAPGADYGQIRISYDGIESLCVDDSGDLRIATAFGTLTDRAPLVWQEIDGERTDVTARFEVRDERTYRIVVDGEVDVSRELVIDPDVEWMYYLGGSGQDYGNGVAVDSAGNALVTGETNSTDFAGRNNSYSGGQRDAFVLKVSPSGELLWMTYLGGSAGEFGQGIALDGAGNALVTGRTDSTDFTGRNNSHYGGTDAFVLKVSPSGKLLWMTYLGGSRWDYGEGIAVDSADNALVGGVTGSFDFAGRNNSHYGGFFDDAFALKVSPSGEVQWMTYLGGSRDDWGSDIAVDSSGNALLMGNTESVDFAGRNNSHHGGNEDAFALKVNPSGQVLWMTYLGGSDWDSGGGITVDSASNALVAGSTESTDFAGRNNSYYGGLDAFALKVSPSGQLLWMTYLGGSGWENGIDIAVEGAGNALVTGMTESADFAGRSNSFSGISDAFALKVSPAGQILWMAYLGGSGFDLGRGIAVDRGGNALVTGYTRSGDFAGRNNSRYGGETDAFIVKLRDSSTPRLTINATCPGGGSIQISWEGAMPGGQVAVIFARNTGSFAIPPQYPCSGTQLGLGSNQIQIAFQGGAGANGSRTIKGNAPSGACGGYMQLLDLTPCATSNVASVE